MNTIQQTLPQTLGTLYQSYGYMPYTMSKFEEYELYLRNKDFLVSDRVLTFTDTDGKLMALKPDVTLSIIKNTRQAATGIQKLFYRENVYRPGSAMQGFREILQIGLECMGAVDSYCVFEVLTLAVKSLRSISPRCVLDVSHMGLLSELLDRAGLKGESRAKALTAIGSKNSHELAALCSAHSIPADELLTLVDLCGPVAQVLPKLETLFPDSLELTRFMDILQALNAAGCGSCVRIDFSVINDMKYYNGIVFRGFVEGVPEGVLSGGQYDGLMEKMYRREKAIGFAVYPDLLERLEPPKPTAQPDAMVLYPADASLTVIAAAVEMLTDQGLRVCAQPDTGPRPAGLRLYTLEGNEVKLL